MDKTELKKRLNDLKQKIKSNSVDKHFAETLLADYKTLAVQIKHEPTLIHIPVTDGDKIYKGDTFEMYSTPQGVAYHTYGGYTIYAKRNSGNSGLCDLIDDIVLNHEEYDKLEGEPEENFRHFIQAFAYCLNIPTLCSQNAEFLFKIATFTVEYLIELQKKAEEQALQEETYEEDNEFEDAVKSIEEVQEELKKED